MIFDVLMGIVVGVFTGFLALIPAYDLPAMTDLGATIGGSLSAANGVFPVATLGICLLTVLGVQLFLVVWHAILFVYDRFPFKAT